jgi:hypothetical protein
MSLATPIIDHNKLTEDQIALINKVNASGFELEKLVTELSNDRDVDKWWVDIGKTQLQVGMMGLVRAIAKPTTF